MELSEIKGVPDVGRLSFTVLRDGSRLGTHHVSFSRENETLIVDIAVDYIVKLGFITLFRYRMRGREEWVSGVLQTARADTNDNGKTDSMRAERVASSLMVEGTAARRYQAPEGTMIGTHWNQAQLNVPVVNPQNGELLRFAAASRGAAKVVDTAGQVRTAERFTLTGKRSFDLWYDPSRIWTSLRIRLGDGSVVSYKPQA